MESKKIQGKLESLNTQEGNTNGKDWKRYELVLDGYKYSTFDGDLVKDFKSGDTISLDLEKSDRYWQVVDARKVSEPQVFTESPEKNTSKPKASYLEKPKTRHLVLHSMDPSEFKESLNQACAENNVFASQTHVENGKWFAVLFFN